MKKTLTIHSFGFPVKITNAPVIQKMGVEVLNIGNKDLDALVIQALIVKHGKLTGNEIKFIRNKLGMTLVAFGKKFGDHSHQAVMKWEATKNKPTQMNDSTEQIIRLFLAHTYSSDKLSDLFVEIINDDVLHQKQEKELKIAL
jgi:DNA-binding transcriptional regulator YiaG